MSTEGRITWVHVLAEFTCDLCGNVCERMTRARPGSNTADRPPGEVVCNDCERARRKSDEEKRKVALQQRRWAQKRPVTETKP